MTVKSAAVEVSKTRSKPKGLKAATMRPMEFSPSGRPKDWPKAMWTAGATWKVRGHFWPVARKKARSPGEASGLGKNY
jgi:hypothetical protein